MKSKKRWIQTVLNESTKSELQTPWARGANRAAWRARVAARAMAKTLAAG